MLARNDKSIKTMFILKASYNDDEGFKDVLVSFG